MISDIQAKRGRAAQSNRSGRFESNVTVPADDGWESLAGEPPQIRTTVTLETPRTILARNTSPDIPFDRSINPYRGCEHGCIYCYARPSHAFMGLSPGLDFETKLFAKPDAAALLRAELGKRGYKAEPIAMGTNTDPYQPIESHMRITRSILEVLAETGHPVTFVTKSHLITRDIDILGPMGRAGLAKVAISVTTLDRKLARAMEPRASTPERRLDAIAALAGAGIPTGVMVAPIIPTLTDHEMEAILERAADAGAREANYILLRLPLEIKDLFREWLAAEVPGRAKRVMSLLQSMRGGRDNDPRFGHRMRGQGEYAQVLSVRFKLAAARLGLTRRESTLDTSQFRPPRADTRQLSLL